MNNTHFIELLATMANEYCATAGCNEEEIDRFIEYVYRTHYKIDLLMLRSDIS